MIFLPNSLQPPSVKEVGCQIVMRGWRLCPRALRMICGLGGLSNKKIYSDYLQVSRG